MQEKRNRWSVGLASWVVQDGNYDDFHAGQRAEFAVEFYTSSGYQDATGEPVGAKHLGDDRYEVVARLAHIDQRGFVLDFGILAYREGTPPDGIEHGATVRARLTLGVDPFFYFEDLARDPAWPDLIYTWDVSEIWRETTPFMRTGNVLTRDESKLAHISVPRTDAWHDDEGNGDYVLVCDMADAQRKRRSTTAR